jgi:hypothetical protein
VSDLPTPDQVREAVDKFEEEWCDGVNIVELTRIIDTTRAYASGSLVTLPRCKTCGGSGQVPGTAGAPHHPKDGWNRCPDCVDGWPRELVERWDDWIQNFLSRHFNIFTTGGYGTELLDALREETQ